MHVSYLLMPHQALSIRQTIARTVYHPICLIIRVWGGGLLGSTIDHSNCECARRSVHGEAFMVTMGASRLQHASVCMIMSAYRR